jgi:hypothetical protein
MGAAWVFVGLRVGDLVFGMFNKRLELRRSDCFDGNAS